MSFFRQNKKNNIYNNRINFLIAIVFLFGVFVLLRLFDLQVLKNELYSAKADSQHQVYSELEPERGEIFILDNDRTGATIYPFATNKDFALIYAIPSEINIEAKDGELGQAEIAEKIFEAFDKEKTRLEVDEYFMEKDKKELEIELGLVADWSDEDRVRKEAEIKYNFNLLRSDSVWLELRNEKKKEEVDKRKKEIVKEYLKKIEKRNDPYEPIKNKVDTEKLKEFYSLLLSNENTKVSTSSLSIKNGLIYKEGQEKSIGIKGISYIMKKNRYYPEGNIGSQILGFVNIVDDQEQGNYGLEGFFNKELFGQYGSIKSERGANREIIIVNDREYVKPKNGISLVLSINRSIEFFVCGELEKAVKEYDADSGSIIIQDPKTGAIIAMCSFPDFDPNNHGQVEDMSVYNNPVVFQQYEPGSVFKTISIAAAMDKGKISPNTLYDDKGSIMIEGWPKPIRNSDFETRGGHGMVDMNYVLVNSLNTGAIFAMLQAGDKVFAEYVKNFGFGERTGIELESESPGNIESLLRDKIRPVEAATASFGQGITVTPLQMINSYSAIVNNGILMKPFIVKEIIYEDGNREVTKPVQLRRVISERTANLIMGMLANVVEDGHGVKAAVDGYFIGGKTGTAQVASKDNSGYSEDNTIHNFIGFAPVNDPRFVMLIKLDNSKNVLYAANSTAPLFSKIAEFILKYYEVPKER